MWVPAAVIEWFHISKDAVSALREENAAVRAERDALKAEVSTLKTHFGWLTHKVNSLEVEKAALIEVAYKIKLPAPEIVRTPVVGASTQQGEFSFDDLGDDLAKKFGFPTYDPSPIN